MKKYISFSVLIAFILSILVLLTGCTGGMVEGIKEEKSKTLEKLSAPWGSFEELTYINNKSGEISNNSKITIKEEFINGKKFFKIDRELFIKDGSYVSGAVLSSESLLPVSSYIEANLKKDGKSEKTVIKGQYKEKLEITSDRNGEKNFSTLKLPEQYFDNEYLSMAIRLFTPREDFITDVNISSISLQKPAALVLKAIGKEKVKVPYGEFECYKLAFYNKNKSSNDPLIFWISTDAKRNLIKYGQKDNYVELSSAKY